MISVLQNATEVNWFPFPHVVIDNALPEDFYKTLLETRPNVIGEGDNRRFDISAADRKEVNAAWGLFIEYHCSEGFYKEVDSLFNLGLKGTVGMRRRDRADIRLDCQISINTPTKVGGRVCDPHYDNLETKFAGLLYMGEDDAGLEIYGSKDIEYYGKRRARVSHPPVRVIPFRHNRFIGFINSSTSIHSPEPRKPGAGVRKFVNFVVDYGKR